MSHPATSEEKKNYPCPWPALLIKASCLGLCPVGWARVGEGRGEVLYPAALCKEGFTLTWVTSSSWKALSCGKALLALVSLALLSGLYPVC